MNLRKRVPTAVPFRGLGVTLITQLSDPTSRPEEIAHLYAHAWTGSCISSHTRVVVIPSELLCNIVIGKIWISCRHDGSAQQLA